MGHREIKKLALVFLLSSVSTAASAESEALKQIRIAPDILCASNINKIECQQGVKALLVATNNLVALNALCEQNKDIRDKMDDDLKHQCDSAREVSEYIKTINPMK